MDDIQTETGYAISMIDYARQRAMEILKTPGRAVLVTNGPAGIQASACQFEADGMDMYLLVPHTSDHLYNLDANPAVLLLAERWKMKGTARTNLPVPGGLALVKTAGAEWCLLVQVCPQEIQIQRVEGWGYSETIEL